jgi:aldehyde:ferredoxin oxidoreductase
MNNPNVTDFGRWGTSASVKVLNKEGVLPTKNFQACIFEGVGKIDSESDDYKKILVGRDTCTGCPIRCKRIVKSEYKGIKIKERCGGPEYKTITAFGSNCLNDDLLFISVVNQMCNQYGLDTISIGIAIAIVMEAIEKKLIRQRLSWGDPDIILELIEDIVFRRGIGNELADGIDGFANDIGADFAMLIKEQEVPVHDPRGKKQLQ